MHTHPEISPFISDTYRGHQIAVLNHGGGWLVYLDHILQNRLKFATSDAAIAWLRRKVEDMGTMKDMGPAAVQR